MGESITPGVPGSPDGPPIPAPAPGPALLVARPDTTTPDDDGPVSSAAFRSEAPDTVKPTAGEPTLSRAFVAALIERWRQRPATLQKRADADKAKAAAHRIVETRTVTVNKTPPAAPGGRAPKPGPKGDGGKGDGGKGAPKGKGSSSSGPDPKGSSKGGGTAPKGSGTPGKGPSSGTPTKSPKDARKDSSSSPTTSAASGSKDKDPKPKKGMLHGAKNLLKKPHKAVPGPDTASGKPDTAPDGHKPHDGPPKPRIRTQPSREAGYRDGHRIGTAKGHVKAWRDGTRDGHTDADRRYRAERERLDKTRQQLLNKQKGPKVPPKPTEPPNPIRPTADVTPTEVRGVDKDGVTLGTGAERDRLTRGEVRTMKQLERRLEARADQMTQVAERTKGLAAHARAQASRVRDLVEQTRSVKGGATLLPKLERVAEAADVQAGKAEEIHTRALRAADAARAVLANVVKRDGQIYQAVVDSPETEPAEMAFYGRS